MGERTGVPREPVAAGASSRADAPGSFAPHLPAMPRVEAIRNHPLFRSSLDAIRAAEADRVFCRHGLDHLLDVARIMRIVAFEEGTHLDAELVYAAALLHDLGRAEQYRSGEDHDAAGVRIAREILGSLPDGLSFSDADRDAVAAAIAGHRGTGDAAAGGADAAGAETARDLARLLRFADKASRACYACDAREACYWPDEKKNLALRV